MGSKLSIATATFKPGENQSWLGSAHGTMSGDSITLDGDSFLATFTDGVVPSGVVVAKVTATGKYRQYNDANSDGTQVAAGHLLTTVDLHGTTSAVVEDVTAALYWHGEVISANLPTNHGLDAAAKVDLPQVRYV